MPHVAGIPFLMEIVIFLAIAVVLLPVFQWVRISPMLGFLVAGVAVGPNGLGVFTADTSWFGFATFTDANSIAVIAEFEIVFLLFLLGLELSLERLWSMRRLVLGLCSTQMLLPGLVIGGLPTIWGNAAHAANLIRASFALSSTAVVVGKLIQRRELVVRVWRASFSLLLMEYLAVVPCRPCGTLAGASRATNTISELAKLSPQIGAFVLSGLGISSDAVNSICERVRDRGCEGL